MVYTKEERRLRNNEAQRLWRLNNPEKSRESSRLYYKKNIEKEIERGRLYKLNNPEKFKKSHTIGVWRNRGMIHDDFDSVYEIYIHTWICEWCLFEFEDSFDRHLDHNHENGEIRGILCRECNTKDVLHN